MKIEINDILENWNSIFNQSEVDEINKDLINEYGSGYFNDDDGFVVEGYDEYFNELVLWATDKVAEYFNIDVTDALVEIVKSDISEIADAHSEFSFEDRIFNKM